MAQFLTKQLLLSHKKLLITSLCLGILGGSFTAANMADAAIPVIDTANIAKQAQTWAETVKIVNTTTQQVALMLKDMKILPESVYNKYVQNIEKGHNDIANILNQKGGAFVGTPGFNGSSSTVQKVDVQQFLTTQIPGIATGDFSTSSRQAAVLMATGAVLRNNENTLEIYQQITKALSDASNEMTELLKENQNVEGTVQAQQIASQIAAKQVQIDSYRAYLAALDGQQRIIRDQAEAQTKKNDIESAANIGRANREAIEQDTEDYKNTPGTNYVFGGPWR